MCNNFLSQLAFILPELLITLGTVVLLMVGAFYTKNSYRNVGFFSLCLLVLAAAFLNVVPSSGTAFNGAVSVDNFTKYIKLLILVGSFSSIIMAYNKQGACAKFELFILYLFATVGMLLMVSAANMLSLYLSLELQSLALYALAAFSRNNLRSSEAGAKYFILGSLSSGILLYGISLIYGCTGQIGFYEIFAYFANTNYTPALVFGVVFVIIAMAFKISAAPFHMWAPDVYEGSPTIVTAFFAGAPKIASFALLTRLAIHSFAPLTAGPDVMHAWQQLIMIISVCSMLIGAFGAIGQTNIKRLIAYSSIGHIGYILVSLISGTTYAIFGVVTYLTIYLATTIGLFSFLLVLKNEHFVLDIKDLSGLNKSNSLLATAVTIYMFSLAGIPPLAGFFAKWYAFAAAVQSGFVALALVGVVTSVISAFYYLRVIKIIWFDDPKLSFDNHSKPLLYLIGITSAFLVFYIIFAGKLNGIISIVANSLY